MENASSYLALMPISKEEIKTFAFKIKDEILSGNIEPLKIAVQLKAMEELISTLRKDPEIKEEIISILEKNNRTMDYCGAELTLRNKNTYYYLGDATCALLTKEIESLDVKLKARQDFLKLVKEPLIDENTGEVINPLPVKCETTLVVSFSQNTKSS